MKDTTTYVHFSMYYKKINLDVRVGLGKSNSALQSKLVSTKGGRVNYL